jgi:hypothetical protein
MICPSCKTETQIQEEKTEYIYPTLFLGVPTFWGFMTPSIARLVTTIIFIIGIIMALMGINYLVRESYVLATGLLMIVVMIIYTIVVCINSLGQYRIKKHYKCLSCRLEWCQFIEDKLNK